VKRRTLGTSQESVVFVVLVVAWLLGWGAFHVAGGLIHLLLIVAVISLIVHFVRGRETGAWKDPASVVTNRQHRRWAMSSRRPG
jgi:hypothetical protein